MSTDPEVRRAVLVRLPESMVEELRRESKESGRSLQAIMEKAVLIYFAVQAPAGSA